MKHRSSDGSFDCIAWSEHVQCERSILSCATDAHAIGLTDIKTKSASMIATCIAS